MFIPKEEKVSLASPTQIRLSVAGDRRLSALARALSRTQSDLGRELIEEGLDSLGPADASALMADYLDLSPRENGDLHLSSDAVEIFFVGSLDTDGQYCCPQPWREMDDEQGDLADFIGALRAEMRRMVPEVDGWSWYDWPASHLVFAFSPTLSDAGMDRLCRMADEEKLGQADRQWDAVWAEVSAL